MLGSILPLTLRQLKGLRHAPERLTRQLVLTASQALESLGEARNELRMCQEQRAAEQLDKDDRLLVVLHRDGFVEVWASDWRPVKIACMPDLGRERYEEAEQYMLGRIPLPYRDIYERTGKQIVAGHSGGCMNLTTYKLLQIEVATINALREVEQAQEKIAV